jgi:hypothetical protein
MIEHIFFGVFGGIRSAGSLLLKTIALRDCSPRSRAVAVSNDWFPPPASAVETVPPLSALAPSFLCVLCVPEGLSGGSANLLIHES